MLQHDLWAAFDWCCWSVNRDSPRIENLRVHLAGALRRLALAKEEIVSLQDNYEDTIHANIARPTFSREAPLTPFLPVDLFDPKGPWVCVSVQTPPLDATASVHVSSFGGRSAFLVFIRLPGGRQETLSYLEQLNTFSEPFVHDRKRFEELVGGSVEEHDMRWSALTSHGPPWVNPKTPQFPPETQLALVRQMIAIDNNGQLIPTSITEDVQLRVCTSIDQEHPGDDQQMFCEFRLSRVDLFAGKTGGLRPVASDETGFTMFGDHGIDRLELPGFKGVRKDMLNCTNCHAKVGIHSMLSCAQFLPPKSLKPPLLTEITPEKVRAEAISWKANNYSWGLLQGLALNKTNLKKCAENRQTAKN